MCVDLEKLWGVVRLVVKSNGFRLTNVQLRELSSYIAIIKKTDLLCISEMTEEADKNMNEKSLKCPENEMNNKYLGQVAKKPTPTRDFLRGCAKCTHNFIHEPASNKDAKKAQPVGRKRLG